MTKIPTLEQLARDEIVYLPLAAIAPDPAQPRVDVDDELAESIKQHGVLQAIQVRPHPSGEDDRYMIVDGERRYRGSLKAKAETIPATITLEVEAVADRIIRQIVRNEGKPLTPAEEAVAFKRAIEDRRAGGDKKYGVIQLAKELGIPKSTVSDRLMLNEIGACWMPLIVNGPLQLSHATILHRWRKVPLKYQERALAQMKNDYRWPADSANGYKKAKKGDRLYVGDFQTLVRTFMRKFVKPVGDVPGYTGPTERFAIESYEGQKTWAMDPGQWQALYRKGLAAKKKRSAARTRDDEESSAPAGQDRWAKQRAKEERAREKFAAVVPALRTAFTEAIATASIDTLLQIILDGEELFVGDEVQRHFPLAKSGNTADAIVRHLAFAAVENEISNEWQAPRRVPSLAKLLGLNLKALLSGSVGDDDHKNSPASSPTCSSTGSVPESDAEDPACKYCGCTENAACELADGDVCSWYDRSVPVCSNPECVSSYQEDVEASSEDSEDADALETVES